MATTVKWTISLPKGLAEFVEEQAAKRERPRSTVLAELLEEKRREIFERELEQAYRETAEESAEFARWAFPLAAETWPPYDTEDQMDEEP